MKYLIEASEKVYYAIEVEANSKEEARNKILKGEVQIDEAKDSSDFEIDNVEEIK